MGIFLLGYLVNTRLDTILQEWVDALEIWQIYLGMYVLIFASIVVIIAPFLSCFAVYQELIQLLMAVSTKCNLIKKTVCIKIHIEHKKMTIKNTN